MPAATATLQVGCHRPARRGAADGGRSSQVLGAVTDGLIVQGPDDLSGRQFGGHSREIEAHSMAEAVMSLRRLPACTAMGAAMMTAAARIRRDCSRSLRTR